LLQTAFGCAGRLHGDLTLPSDVRSISARASSPPSSMWLNWRAEPGTGLAYFTGPPTEQTTLRTADGDTDIRDGKWATGGGGWFRPAAPPAGSGGRWSGTEQALR
jgi:hypothetical protein